MSKSGSGECEHLAIILARGQSSRLGSPKGLAKLPGSEQTLLGAVDELYQSLGWPRLVVTLPELLTPYQAILDKDPQRQWISFGPGGDTARTLRLGCDHLKEKGSSASWLWAHPVDLPLVKPATLKLIQLSLNSKDHRVYRPVHENQPGHPVVFFRHFLNSVFSSKLGDEESGPMRHLLGEQVIGKVLVEDRGVVQDFDTPEDFKKE